MDMFSRKIVGWSMQGYRHPKRITFAEYAERWLAEGEARRQWKPRTVLGYRNALDRLLPAFGAKPLGAIRPRDVAEYVRKALTRPDARPNLKRKGQPFSPATVNLDVSVLHDVLKTARREELIVSNPAEGVERPRMRPKRWRLLEPVEIQRVARAFTDEQARVVFLTLVLTGVRRFELEALRWRDIDLVEGVLRVRDSKTEEGIRAIALSPALAEALWQHRRRSAFQGEDEYVFCHPRTGSPLRLSGSPASSARPSRRPASRTTCGRSTTSGTRRSRTTPRPARRSSRSWRRRATARWRPPNGTFISPASSSARKRRRSSAGCSGAPILYPRCTNLR